jgi:hypothetical protein
MPQYSPDHNVVITNGVNLGFNSYDSVFHLM